jgi:hypothetical protein
MDWETAFSRQGKPAERSAFSMVGLSFGPWADAGGKSIGKNGGLVYHPHQLFGRKRTPTKPLTQYLSEEYKSHVNNPYRSIDALRFPFDGNHLHRPDKDLVTDPEGEAEGFGTESDR